MHMDINQMLLFSMENNNWFLSHMLGIDDVYSKGLSCKKFSRANDCSLLSIFHVGYQVDLIFSEVDSSPAP